MKTEAELVDLKKRITNCGAFDIADTMFLLDALDASNVPELVSPDGGEPGRISSQNTIGLLRKILPPIRRHLAVGPIERDRVLEVLNALAFAVEVVLHGTDHDPKAVAFFEQARALNREAGQ